MRVLEREAELLKQALYVEYERAARQPLEDVIEIAMLAFFRFADQRRPGFVLLFASEPGGPGRGIGERAMDEVIDHVTELVNAYIVRTGHQPGARTPLLAAAGVGVARQGLPVRPGERARPRDRWIPGHRVHRGRNAPAQRARAGHARHPPAGRTSLVHASARDLPDADKSHVNPGRAALPMPRLALAWGANVRRRTECGN